MGRAQDISPKSTSGANDQHTPSLDLTVVIVNYNVRAFLEQALESVRRASGRLSVEVFVVDNNSVDGSVPMVRSRFPDVHLIANDRNVGFGVANNMALERARGRYALILNPDTIVQEDTFDRMVSFMDEHPEAGAVGCQILNPDGTFAPESRRAFPTPQVAFYRMTGLARLFPRSRVFGRYNMTFLPRDEVCEVDALSGSCMMVRTSLLPQVGYFDEDFFMYGEDLDLCFRIQQSGSRIYYIPDTQIVHYKGESTKKGEVRYVRLFYGAMVLFTRKHLQGRHSILFAGLLQTAIMVRAGFSVVAQGLGRIAAPLADFCLVVASVTLLGWLRSRQLDAPMSPLFIQAVAPAFGLGTVTGVLLVGGYRTPRRLHVRPALIGLVIGFLVVSASSFFAKSIAFSRVVIAVGLPLSAALLATWRAVWTARRVEPRRAIVVGDREEAERVHALVRAHPRPPFLLDGYVDPSQDLPAPGVVEAEIQFLGAVHHLRDLVRLHQAGDVVFAMKNLSNQRAMSIMQSLRDLPVQFRMLGQDRSHVIGKSAVAELSLPDSSALSDAVTLRSRVARRAFEIPIALLFLLLRPFLALIAPLSGTTGRIRTLHEVSKRMLPVLSGELDLVGADPSHVGVVPEDWRLKPAVFSVSQLLEKQSGTPPTADEILRAYWYYVTHQSATLDSEVIFRVLFAR